MFSPEAITNIIRISLQPITTTKHQLYTESAETALLMVAAHESKLGEYNTQIGGGTARGLYQVEIATMHDNYTNFINYKNGLNKEIEGISGVKGPDEYQLQYNPIYCTIHARLKLYRSPGPLPKSYDTVAISEYLKKYFNTSGGKARAEDYFLAYHHLVLV